MIYIHRREQKASGKDTRPSAFRLLPLALCPSSSAVLAVRAEEMGRGIIFFPKRTHLTRLESPEMFAKGRNEPTRRSPTGATTPSLQSAL